MPERQQPFPNVECEWTEEQVHTRLGGGHNNIGIIAQLERRTWATSFITGALICSEWKPCTREKQRALCPPLMTPFFVTRCRVK